jgi:hypothetical protein
VAIFVLVLWLATAGIGTALLRAGGAARVTAAAIAPAADSQLAAVPARIGALPMTPGGKPPPVPHTRVVARPGEHPLLEFSHPALAIVGLAFWTMFTFVHYRPAAWIAFTVLVATICMGLAWLVRSGRARLARAPGRRFPPRLAALHGTSAALTVLLAVLTAALASR